MAGSVTTNGLGGGGGLVGGGGRRVGAWVPVVFTPDLHLLYTCWVPVVSAMAVSVTTAGPHLLAASAGLAGGGGGRRVDAWVLACSMEQMEYHYQVLTH
jgi:hypothetical protein